MIDRDARRRQWMFDSWARGFGFMMEHSGDQLQNSRILFLMSELCIHSGKHNKYLYFDFCFTFNNKDIVFNKREVLAMSYDMELH